MPHWHYPRPTPARDRREEVGVQNPSACDELDISHELLGIHRLHRQDQVVRYETERQTNRDRPYFFTTHLFVNDSTAHTQYADYECLAHLPRPQVRIVAGGGILREARVLQRRGVGRQTRGLIGR